MRTSRSSQVVLPVLVAFFLVFTAGAYAQVNSFGNGHVAPRGVPASVTSFGFGGHPGFHGVPASVTSQNFGAHIGFRPVPVTPFRGNPSFHFHHRPFERDHHRRTVVLYSPFYGGYYDSEPYPYQYDMSSGDYSNDVAPNDTAAASRAEDDRQVLRDDYRAELKPEPEPQPQPEIQPTSQPVDQPSTVLIFKDGHQTEIANYAIVGATLYDLSDGLTKKVQLAELNLPATVKENDQRGVEFKLPAQAKLN